MAAPKRDSELIINPDDFKSIEIKIIFTNTATNTLITEEEKRIGQSKKEPLKGEETLKMLEMLSDGVLIETPPKSGADGHLVALEVKAENTGPALKLTASAKIEEIQTLDSGNLSMRLKFIQIDEASWKKFQNLFSDRQKAIAEFFDSIKG